jgi:putative glutathione S-transferase
MGLLIDGVWHDQWYDTSATGGRFVRKESSFRSWVTPDGAAGPTGEAGFPAAAGRYHLYVSHACPWAHRTMIVRSLKGLDHMVSVSVVNWLMEGRGWTFDAGPGVVSDPLRHARVLHEVYTHANPTYTGRVTVPVLYDRERDTIVSNESSEVIRMFDSAFGALGATGPDLYPLSLRGEIDRINARVYDTVNNGVYRAGFATTQDAYEEAVGELFASLDWLEALLGERRYLAGEQLTEADIRLFTTLVRFDAVYVGHFKCNLRRIVDYPNLREFTREIYQLPGVRETVHMDHIKGHYYQSHASINPTGIIPVGPQLDLDVPHRRG